MEIKCPNCCCNQSMELYYSAEAITVVIENYKCPNCGCTARRILKISSLTYRTKHGTLLKTEKY